ncbi:aspartate/methionine/tyrosine aminotransferase [Roseivirga pacifica]|uniref:Aminotransferase n=1 Tax=Roseivirga pacifica TaxID=1267423 RepID=A0A1I0QY37_9BACT|nr:aminotransferase class I/II-fold pyridoxal phosphate-dependent enzyme [Roseivirga pacifica]RKQ42390.1 aspartate/methionine/tyrosine aminotransferase [Roseivirga pacifica]SEW32512.1 Aspartate/methionine/tyrosine aminotransferase [Roseivirga pacifica]
MIIQPSSRLNTVKEYYFSEKLAEIRQMMAEGKPVLNLGIGNPDGMPSPQVLQKLKETTGLTDVHGYQSYVGIPELKQAIAEWNNWAYGIDLDAEQEVLPLIGSKEGITHISLAFLDEGDEVLVPELAYPAYSAVAQMIKAKVVTYPLDEMNNYQPDWRFLEELNTDKVKLMWLNYPHMPTGASAQLETFERLVAFAKARGVLLCHDNPYSMILPKAQPLSLLAVNGAKEVALELNSLSKSFNMAGWRMGWVAGRADYIKTILKVKSNVDSGMFKPMMLAATEALKLRQEWFDELNAVYESRRVKAYELLDKIGCTYSTDQQGMFIWAHIPEKFESAKALVDDLLYEKNVFITPGVIFGEKGANYVRISLCSTEAILDEAISRI